jgi:glycogen debranching enzyme
MDARCLALMADELGRSAEARTWREQADTLGKLIVETMYFPEEAMFYDVKVGTHEKFSGVKSPNMFLPLWAGVPLPREEVKAIVERHMLNPDEFFRELPFPSLSYDNPKYNPKGYWRGRIWPHVVYWMIQTLWRQGYQREAELTADRLVKMFQRTPFFHENYESDAGGVDPGCPDYNWSCATVIQLLQERYKDPLP